MNLIFATNNKNKVDEVRQALHNAINIITLKDAGIDIDIPEPFDSLHANAAEKARVIYEITGNNCLSEDSGLMINALNGEPGIRSARYAGDHRSDRDNIHKVISKMGSIDDRTAAFHTVIALNAGGKTLFFEGICKGIILYEPSGNGGFGYDPIFIPDGADKSFGEMTIEEKAVYSHRKKATEKLVLYLNTIV